MTGIADALLHRCRGLDEQLVIARNTVASRQKTVDLFKRRELGGVSNRVEVSQAEAELADAVAVELDTERLIANQETVVSLLLGRGPSPIPRGTTLSDQSLPPEVPPGIPSLAGAAPGRTGSGGVAAIGKRRDWRREGRLLPRISLTGLFGWVSPQLDKLLSEPQTVWSVGGNIVQPIFTGDASRATCRHAQGPLGPVSELLSGHRTERLPGGFRRPGRDPLFRADQRAAGPSGQGAHRRVGPYPPALCGRPVQLSGSAGRGSPAVRGTDPGRRGAARSRQDLHFAI